MRRCTTVTIRQANIGKKLILTGFIDEYTKIVRLFIDLMWSQNGYQKYGAKKHIDQVKSQTWLSITSIQCAVKQASAIVRGTRLKNDQRQYRYNLLLEEGKTKHAARLLEIIEKNKISKPVIKNVNPELDYRFIDTYLNKNNFFDGWIKIQSIGNKQIIWIPFKRTIHFNKLYAKGGLRPGLRLFRNKVQFNFKTEEPAKRDYGNTLGLDMGIKKVFVSSDGQMSSQDKNGWDLTEIQNRLKARKKGSKNFKQTQQHQKNYINWTINRLNLDGIKYLHIEDLKNVKKGRKCSRFLQHWCYPLIKGKLAARCEETGVQLTLINPAYTSQRCSQCGWVQKSNRYGELFKCKVCGYAMDADLNASVNIGLNLPILNRERLAGVNRTGFYWNTVGEAPTVPHYPKLSRFS